MAAENITLNPNQTKALKQIIAGGKVTVGAGNDVDGRTARALEARGFVKVTENKQGLFASPTAKGKKFTN
jgi:hypothetical protein